MRSSPFVNSPPRSVTKFLLQGTRGQRHIIREGARSIDARQRRVQEVLRSNRAQFWLQTRWIFEGTKVPSTSHLHRALFTLRKVSLLSSLKTRLTDPTQDSRRQNFTDVRADVAQDGRRWHERSHWRRIPPIFRHQGLARASVSWRYLLFLKSPYSPAAL